MKLLLDPVLLLDLDLEDMNLNRELERWDQVVDWSNDERVRLGAASCDLILDRLQDVGYPDNRLELQNLPGLRAYSDALNKLLARVLTHQRPTVDLSLSPRHNGDRNAGRALCMDIAGTNVGAVYGVATRKEHWEEGVWESLKISPPPPGRLELCFEPNQELQVEGKARMKEFFYGRRLHIVGGKVSQRLISEIGETFGVARKSINWLPCEKSKPPNDLASRWSGLRPERDVAICITGRVGHATSGNAEAAASKAGVPYIPVEFDSGIVLALRNHALMAAR